MVHRHPSIPADHHVTLESRCPRLRDSPIPLPPLLKLSTIAFKVAYSLLERGSLAFALAVFFSLLADSSFFLAQTAFLLPSNLFLNSGGTFVILGAMVKILYVVRSVVRTQARALPST